MENTSVFNSIMVLLGMLKNRWILHIHTKGCAYDFSVKLHYEFWGFSCFALSETVSYVVGEKYFHITLI